MEPSPAGGGEELGAGAGQRLGGAAVEAEEDPVAVGGGDGAGLDHGVAVLIGRVDELIAPVVDGARRAGDLIGDGEGGAEENADQEGETGGEEGRA